MIVCGFECRSYRSVKIRDHTGPGAANQKTASDDEEKNDSS